jgi:hypothetical protein
MDHAMAIGTQHRKVGRHIISDCDPLLEARNRLEMMSFDKTFADRAIARFKIKITGLAYKS